MYLVTGTTGNTGAVVARTLLSQGAAVLALVRDPRKATALRESGAELVTGELDDTAALTRALAGADGAYFLLPPHPTSPQVLADQARIAESIAQAVARSGVKHVVLLSSIAAQHPAGTGPIRTMHGAEARLRKTGAALTFVRAAYFMENWGASLGGVAGGVLPTFLREGLTLPMVATRDIGAAAARALAEGGKGVQIIELAGPREYSAADVAAAVSSIVGKPVVPQYGPEEAIVPTFTGFGLSADMAGLYREMLHFFNSGGVGFEGGAARHVRGATPIEDVLRPMLAGK